MTEQMPPVVRAVAEVAASGGSFQDNIGRALQAVCDHLGFTSAAVYRNDTSCRELKAVSFHGFSERIPTRLRIFPLSRSEAMARLCRGELPHLTHADGTPDVGSRFARELALDRLGWAFVPLKSGAQVVGVAGFLAAGREEEFDPEEIARLEVLSDQLAAILVAGTEHERLESETAQLREDLRASHAMLRAAEVMAEKTDLNAVLEALVQVVNQETGRYSIVTMLSKGFTEISVVASSGGKHTPGEHVPIGTLDPVLKQSLVERRTAVIESGPMPASLGMPSGRFVSVPLLNDGALLGNIEVDDPPTDRDELTREIRVLQGIAFEAGAAIANARLYEQQRRSAGLREALNDVNATLNESIERPGLLEPVLERATRAFPVDGALLALLHEDRWVIESVAGDSTLRLGDELPPGDVMNAKHALRAGAPVLRPEGYADPLVTTRVPAVTGIVLVVPLQLGTRPFGALFFRRENWSQTLDSETLDFATKLGVSVSLTLGNRYLYEHEHRVSETLQQALLSMPDVVPGIALSHLYLAAAERTRVGGDFYDAFELYDGKVALVIGDVSGKGLDAAALTALAKNALKAHAIEGLSPSEVLTKTNSIIYKFSSMETFVTVFFCVLDPSNGQITYCNGGHLAPLLFSKRGTRSLEAEGSLLGAFTDSEYEEHSDVLERDETMLLYTDGLTEARSITGELYGDERLAEALSKMHRMKVAEVPRRVMTAVERFSDSGLSDDVAILVVRLDKTRWHINQ